MSPAIREIRRIYPNAHITLSVLEKLYNIAELCPYIDEIILDTRHCDWRNFLSLYQWNLGIAKKLLLHRYSLCFPVSIYPSSVLLSYMGGVQKFLSFKPTPSKPGTGVEPFNQDIYEPFMCNISTPDITINETNVFGRSPSILDSLLQYPVTNREGEAWLGASDRAYARDLIGSYISNGNNIYVICMGGTNMSKMWSPQNYARLAQMIVEQEPNTKFVITGGGQIDGQSAALFKQSVDEKFFNEHVVDVTNKATYRQSGALIELADIYIGNDTGTMNLAAAVKTPILMPHYFPADLPKADHTVLKGAYPYHVPSVTIQPKHALPECRNSDNHYGCIMFDRPHCITQVTVDTVFDGYNKLKERIAQNNCEPLFIS